MVLGGAMGLGILTGFGSGFAFGTGYGAGVRFGYEDVYPYLKGNMSQIATMLQIPFASSGFKLASGVTAQQGMGLQDAESIIGKTNDMGLTTSDSPEASPSGRMQAEVVPMLYKRGMDTTKTYAVQRVTTSSDPRYKYQLDYYRYKGGKWVLVGRGFTPKPFNTGQSIG